MTKKANIDVILSYAKEGLTVKQIVEKTKYADCTVRKYLKNAEISVTSRKSKITDETLELIKIFVDEGKTNAEIAKLLNISPTTARKYTNFLGRETNSVKAKPIKEENIELSKQQLDILYGTLLGDASIEPHWKEARVVFNQGGTQEAYFDYKCSFFEKFLGKISKTQRYDKRTNKYYNKYQVRFKCHKIFTQIYQELYPNGVKTVTKEWLSKITPIGLAFWFMDDGTNNGTLATNCFSYEECQLIREWFLNAYNIQTTIENQKNKNGIQYLIYIKAQSKKQFYELVKPFIIPEMEYKFKNWNL